MNKSQQIGALKLDIKRALENLHNIQEELLMRETVITRLENQIYVMDEKLQRAHALIESLTHRVAVQSDLLARRSEKATS